jgi:hypothetical protein
MVKVSYKNIHQIALNLKKKTKQNTVGMLSLESFRKLEHIVFTLGLIAPFMFNISHMGVK